MLLFEIRKLLKKGSSFGGILVVFIILLGLLYGLFFKGQLSGYSSDKIKGRDSIVLNANIANRYSGSLSDEKIETIITDFVKNSTEYKKNGFFDIFSWYISNEFILDYSSYDNELKNFDENNIFDIQKVKLKKVDELGLTVPLNSIQVGNFASWNQLFQILSATFILVGVFLIYICSPVFSGDTMKGILPLLLTTKFGKTKLTLTKLFATFLIFLASFTIIYGLIFIIFSIYFGLSGSDTSVQMNFYWKFYSFPIPMNLFQFFIYFINYQFIALLLVTSTTSLISYFTKNTFTTLSLSLGIFFLPQLLLRLFKGGLINKLLTFFPISNFNAETMLLKLSNSETFFFTNFYTNYFVLIFVMGLFRYCQ